MRRGFTTKTTKSLQFLFRLRTWKHLCGTRLTTLQNFFTKPFNEECGFSNGKWSLSFLPALQRSRLRFRHSFSKENDFLGHMRYLEGYQLSLNIPS
ncbi:hypothetical protein GE061_008385 [Apolygus lucorum]|uniref:Uncharacterized protein n=1 Tax=Apolygus lucorum TaxID=248454 RepID=A0A8S9WPQ9_APOLU|nr:hypothetical protein GE061_008385 [Apolygus lucorum]